MICPLPRGAWVFRATLLNELNEYHDYYCKAIAYLQRWNAHFSLGLKAPAAVEFTSAVWHGMLPLTDMSSTTKRKHRPELTVTGFTSIRRSLRVGTDICMSASFLSP